MTFLLLSVCPSNEDISPDELNSQGRLEVSFTGNDNREITGYASFVRGIVTSEVETENGSVLMITLLNATGRTG
jgi:hypothetical protein